MAKMDGTKLNEQLAEKLGFEIRDGRRYVNGVAAVADFGHVGKHEIALWNLCLELSERLRWIPVEEKLPEDGVTVLVSAIRGNGERWSVQSHHFGISGWYPLDDQSSATRPKITHWMYLPEEP